MFLEKSFFLQSTSDLASWRNWLILKTSRFLEKDKKVVENMEINFKKGGCLLMRLKYISHTDTLFSWIVKCLKWRTGRKSHQDINEMEQRYEGRWNTNINAGWITGGSCEENYQKELWREKKKMFYEFVKRGENCILPIFKLI